MVAVMTDTNSGITVQEGRENGIYVLPMPVIVNNQCYMESIDITHVYFLPVIRSRLTA